MKRGARKILCPGRELSSLHYWPNVTVGIKKEWPASFESVCKEINQRKEESTNEKNTNDGRIYEAYEATSRKPAVVENFVHRDK